jgi:hypothetical protein
VENLGQQALRQLGGRRYLAGEQRFQLLAAGVGQAGLQQQRRAALGLQGQGMAAAQRGLLAQLQPGQAEGQQQVDRCGPKGSSYLGMNSSKQRMRWGKKWCGPSLNG